MRRYLLPLLVFCVLVGFLAVGLKRDPHQLPSPLIDKAAPAFSLPTLASPEQKLSPQDLRGKVWLLNVWASWCVACRQEHALLVDMAKTGAVPIYGLNYKDKREDAQGWLTQFGNPYAVSLSDTEGVPETFVIDKAGVIRLKHIGPITPEALRDTLLPLLKKLGA
jgi:cytochrome c biogenesis protein CcmG/thiol:disulfide interchange protein DsbE